MLRRTLHLSVDTATPGPEQEPQRRWAAIAALRHRNFRLFWGGQVISLIGTWMQTVAQGYLVYHLTHSAAMLGVVTTLASLPVLLLTLFGGALADRLPKRRVLVGTQSSAAALPPQRGPLSGGHPGVRAHAHAAVFGGAEPWTGAGAPGERPALHPSR